MSTGDWIAVGSPVPQEPLAARRPDRLAWNWFSPSPEMRRGRERFGTRSGIKVVAVIVMSLLGLLLGANLVIAAWFDATGRSIGETSEADLEFNAWLGLGLLVVPSLLWVFAFYRATWRAWGSRLLLRTRHPLRDTALGVAAVLVILALEFLASLALDAAGVSQENPGVDAIAPHLTWGLVVLISLSAGIGEEVFFRGLLQGRIGVVPANLLFGAAHFGYGTPLQVLFPIAFGFLFSWLVLRTRSLVPAIVAHILIDVVALSVTKLAVA